MLACCHGLLSPALELTQAKIKFSPVLLGLQLTARQLLVSLQTAQVPIASAEYDTGPPRENSFLQTVLKRSLPVNAPPFLA
jgi:hypothetical protein